MSGRRTAGEGVPLWARIFSWMALVALLPLVVMAGQGYHCARMAVLDSTHRHLEAVAEERAARLADWVAERRADLMLLAADPRLGAADAGLDSETAALLDRFRERSAAFETLALVDEDGRWITSNTSAAHQASDFPDLDRLLREAGGGWAAGLPHHHGTGVGIHFVEPVGASARPGRYVLGALDLESTLKPLLSPPRGFGPAGRVLLRSGTGALLAATEGTDRAGPAGGGADGGDARLEEGNGTDRSVGNVLEARAPVAGTDWHLVAQVDRDAALRWLRILRWRAVGVGIVTLVVVLLLSNRVSRQLARPLRRLADAAARIAAGRHELRVQIDDGREARQVSQAFNRMLDHLARAQKRVVRSASLAAVGEVITSVVHEMRNPLSSVKVSLQAMAPGLAGDPALTEMAALATTQVQRLEAMLEDLLRYGKPLELRPESVSLRRIVDETRLALGLPPIGESGERGAGSEALHGAEIRFVDRTGGATVEADRERLVQALSNLVRNAAQAMAGAVALAAGGGGWEVDDRPGDGVPAVEIAGGVRPGGGWRIEVRDRGPGLPQGAREQLFRPFFTTRPDGIGLGLANVRKIVEAHGGRVGAEDRPGGGAVFWIEVPAQGI